jgi:hypothetical protein
MADIDEKVREETGRGKPVGLVSLTVQVIPQILLNSGEIPCQIEAAPGTPPGLVKGGVIKLAAAGHYAITFQLMQGDVQNLQFDCSDPIWTSQAGCPTSSAHDPQFTVQSCAGTSLVVSATPIPPKNAVFYRLNFTLAGTSPPLYCDPIIINN